MRWLDHRGAIPPALRGAVIALGNFDGFHRGHQAVAGEAIRWAQAEGRPSIIATFDPHPVRFFRPDVPPFRLTTLEQRQELYLAAGATAMLVFHFDAELAAVAEILHTDGTRSERACDILVGADGIHSALRQQFHPDEGAPRWNGMMMWRGTTLARPFLDGRTMVQAGHRRAKFVVYPIEPVRPDGLQRINWICDRRLREDGFGGGLTAPSREDWSKPGSLDDLLPTFGSWRFAWLDVPGLIRAAEQILEWPMVDRDPLPRWRHGHTTLLGDAAHPMYPIGSNGATQAILDAAALADALDGHASITAALNAYEAARLPMTRDIVAMNRREGLDAILDMVEEAAPEGFARIEDVTDPTVLAEWVQAYKKTAGHQVGRPQAAP